jgi:hypothetical protein
MLLLLQLDSLNDEDGIKAFKELKNIDKMAIFYVELKQLHQLCFQINT